MQYLICQNNCLQSILPALTDNAAFDRCQYMNLDLDEYSCSDYTIICVIGLFSGFLDHFCDFLTVVSLPSAEAPLTRNGEWTISSSCRVW